MHKGRKRAREDFHTQASNITDFLQQTLSERLSLVLESYEKNVKSFPREK